MDPIRVSYIKRIFALVVKVEQQKGNVQGNVNDFLTGVRKWEASKFKRCNEVVSPQYHAIMAAKLQVLQGKLPQASQASQRPVARPPPPQRPVARVQPPQRPPMLHRPPNTQEEKLKQKFFEIKSHMQGTTCSRIVALKNFFSDKLRTAQPNSISKFQNFIMYLDRCDEFLNAPGHPSCGYEAGLRKLHSIYKTIKDTEARVSNWKIAKSNRRVHAQRQYENNVSSAPLPSSSRQVQENYSPAVLRAPVQPPQGGGVKRRLGSHLPLERKPKLQKVEDNRPKQASPQKQSDPVGISKYESPLLKMMYSWPGLSAERALDIKSNIKDFCFTLCTSK